MKKPSIFSTKLRELARSIPKGKVTTYGLLARAAGGGGQAARSVSSILAKDPDYKSIPFHRIVYSNGKVWCNESSGAERIKILKKEGIPIDKKGRIEFFQDYLYLK
jgi:methylated-DNA-protein-cysteine methyltransferase-like protein